MAAAGPAERSFSVRRRRRLAGEMTTGKNNRKTVPAKVPNVVFEAVRDGNSLFAACRCAGISTRDFYAATAADEALCEAYQLALADYADRCTDDIRKIVADLKAGEIDNSTAKLLIETEKWLAQKSCPEPVWDKIAGGGGDGEDGGVAEIVVKFV